MTTEITKILEGFKQFSENPYSDAIKFLKEYIEVDPTSEAFFELGKALFFNGEHDESIKYLNKSDDSRSDAYLGLNFYSKEDYPNAIMHFNEFLKSEQNETALSYLLISYEKISDWKNAILTGERLLEINKKNKSIKIRMVDYHYHLKEYEKSLYYINELNDKKLQCKKGLILFFLKRYDETIQTLKSIKTTEAYTLIAKAYIKQNKHMKAISYIFKSYESKRDPEILFEFSDIYLESRDYKKSIHLLKRALDENPNNVKALEKIAHAYMKNYEAELAITYAEEVLKLDEDNLNAHIILSEVYYQLNDGLKSLEHIQKGLELNPKSTELWIMKAWIFYPLDFEGFRKSFEKVIELEPNNTENYITLIKNCTWENEIDNARRYYDRLMFYNPTFPESFDDLTKDIIDYLNNDEYLSWCPYCGL